MALLESCCGCSLTVSSAVLGVYLLVAYIIAFTIELWWILDPSVTAPVAAYLLCLGYFVLFAFSTVLLHGLSIKRTAFLLLWLFMMGILLGPEAGLVLYTSIHYWRITTVNGLIEITCWACRLLVNAAGIICVQSLHSSWREEKSVLLRLEALKMQAPIHKAPNPIDGRGGKVRVPALMKTYNNHGFEDEKYISEKPETKTPDILPVEESGTPTGEDGAGDGHVVTEEGELFQTGLYSPEYPDSYFTSGFNEFNASSFDPTLIDSRLPYLTIRQKPKILRNPSRKLDLMDLGDGEQITPKTHSLLDLSVERIKNVEVVNSRGGKRSPPLPLSGCFTDDEIHSNNRENPLGSPDGKIIKNKNLKILKKLSPFCRRKSNEIMNIYRINPPAKRLTKDAPPDLAQLDSQLNEVYRNRGMYAFEEKTRKIVFYPPELFHASQPRDFRDRRRSSMSSLSQSSIDSEDIKQISDVAL